MFISIGEIKDALRTKMERERNYRMDATPAIEQAHQKVIQAYARAIRAIEDIGRTNAKLSELTVARLLKNENRIR